MVIPKEWQTPEAQQALADALNRALRNAWANIDAGALRGCTIEELRDARHWLTRPAHGMALPRGAELDRRVKLAKQGDKLAALEVHSVLATDLRRGTLDARERELLASMLEATARGADPAAAMLLAKPPSRPIETRKQAFIANWIALEIEAHKRIKATGRTVCANGCARLTQRAAFDRAASLFGISWQRAKAIHKIVAK